MIFSELLNQKSLYLKDFKLYMAIIVKYRDEPWVQLSEGEFEGWQSQQTKPNFPRPMILSFVFIGKDEWLFAGIYAAGECQEIDGCFQYETTLVSYFAEYIGNIG
ncbi:hypothetical protein [Sphaerochaeta sp. S2]|uniref:hypothetical protein n=1 Tax=Sphaerochaeta sp. S2 TaxID=2798868 RepID=UPI0018E9419C|nr:hypothetical protein [Sphaerochaeta sp. S2]MBJ2355394.1 hypothetical protein [Sphaerochaeta sp. S2]